MNVKSNTSINNWLRIVMFVGCIGLVVGGVFFHGDIARFCFWGGLILICIGFALQSTNNTMPKIYSLVIIPIILLFLGFFWFEPWIFPIPAFIVRILALISAVIFLILVAFRRLYK